MLLFASLTCVLLALVIEFFRRRWNAFRYFEKLGIPYPRPHLLWGHYHLLRKVHLETLNEWCARFGPTFGVFWGDKPFLVTSDLELIQRVMVKDFHIFPNRTRQFALDSAHPLNSSSIFHRRDEAWKRLRGVITPTFTSAKMRNMVPVVQRSVTDFLAVIRRLSQTGEAVDVYPLLKRFTVDNISRTAFGIEASTLANPDEVPRLLKAGLETIENSNVGVLDLVVNSFRTIGEGMRSLLRFLFTYNLIGHTSNDLLLECLQIVTLRRRSGQRRVDLLQALLDANEATTDENSLAATDGDEKVESLRDNPVKRLSTSLTDEEVISNTIIFFLAGYETTSSALGYLLYVLATHSDVQERLRRTTAEFDQDDLYASVMRCKYLDQVVHEALRLYPPVTSFVTRSASTSFQHGSLTLPAGLGIYVPVFQLHRNPDVWPDPLEFRPERFERRDFHPMAYQAFGAGPRNCVGMRFALLTIKLLVFEILQCFRITAEHPMKPTSKYIVSQPDRVVLKFEALR